MRGRSGRPGARMEPRQRGRNGAAGRVREGRVASCLPDSDAEALVDEAQARRLPIWFVDTGKMQSGRKLRGRKNCGSGGARRRLARRRTLQAKLFNMVVPTRRRGAKASQEGSIE